MPDDTIAEPDSSTTGTVARRVHVLGGGLAGMAAAFHLVRSANAEDKNGETCEVILYEGEPRLGGKARSHEVVGLRSKKSILTDKGYHVFPYWYWDLWQLLRDADLYDSVEDERRTPGDPKRAANETRFTDPDDDASRDYALISIDDGEVRVVETSFRGIPFLGWIRDRVGRRAVRTPRQLLPIIRKIRGSALVLFVMLGLIGSWPERLRRRTLEDHLSGRWYAGETTRGRVREIVLKALANPSYDASAFTTANTFRRWVPVYFKANWRACTGPLENKLMKPFEHELCRRGVTIKKLRRIEHITVDGDRIVDFTVTNLDTTQRVRTEDVAGQHADQQTDRIDLSEGAGQTTQIALTGDHADDRVILALPHRVLAGDGFITWNGPNQLGRQAQRAIQNLNYLPAAPMASLDLYFEELPTINGKELPRSHFSLVNSNFAITGFAASRVWDEWHCSQPTKHFVQFVCSDAETLRHLPKEDAVELLVNEIADFIPSLKRLEPRPTDDPAERTVEIVEAVYCLNDGPSSEVTKNEAGSWERRPTVDIELDNARLAGDFCLCPVDVASMEAAVSTGIAAALSLDGDRSEDNATSGATRSGRRARQTKSNDDRNEGTRVKRGGLHQNGVARPIRADLPTSVRNLYRLLYGFAVVGGAISFVANAIIRILAAPHTIARRMVLANLLGQPELRRTRDMAMMVVGALAPVVGIATVLILRSLAEPASAWHSNPVAPGFRPDGELAWLSSSQWLWIGCVLLYLMLMIGAVPARRFPPPSRGIAGGMILAGAGYGLLPLVTCDSACGWGNQRIDALLAAFVLLVIAGGALVSCGTAVIDLEYRKRLNLVRTTAKVVLGLLVVGTLAMVGQWFVGSFTSRAGRLPLELAVLLIGLLWFAGLSIYLLLRKQKEAQTDLIRGPLAGQRELNEEADAVGPGQAAGGRDAIAAAAQAE